MKEFGEGIDRICNELESRGAAIPSFHTDAFILKATLKAEFVEEHIAVEKLSDGETENTDVAVNVAVNNGVELSERQKNILKLIGTGTLVDEKNVAVNVAVNTKLLAEKLGLNRKTIQRELNHLQKQGVIRWVGADKNGHWELK